MSESEHGVKRQKEKEEKEEKQEEEKKKQKKEDKNLNRTFLDACEYGTLERVKELLEKGADIFYASDRFSNALHRACRRVDCGEAEEIVRYLIKKAKILLQTIDDEQWSPLHFAARFSSAKICKILLDHRAILNATTSIGMSPLILCCNRDDLESVEVAKLLIIERKADLSMKDSIFGHTALHYACWYARPELVQVLLDAGCHFKARGENEASPLKFVARNRPFGAQIAQLLMTAGAGISTTDISHGMQHAFNRGNVPVLKAMAPYAPANCLKGFDSISVRRHNDPIGLMTESRKFGYTPETVSFAYDPSVMWAQLRSGAEFDVSSLLYAMEKRGHLGLWITAASELWQRGKGSDPVTDETLLHLAVRAKKLSAEDKLKVAQHIMSFKINPLVLNKNNKRAIDYCGKEEKELHDILVHYQQWRPEKKVMSWYGPYCRQRLRAFLLVESRLKLGFPRDLKNLILSHIAAREYVWVPK
jgi:ankyrin repeat protein